MTLRASHLITDTFPHHRTHNVVGTLITPSKINHLLLTSASSISVMLLLTSLGKVTNTDLRGRLQASSEHIPRTSRAEAQDLILRPRVKLSYNKNLSTSKKDEWNKLNKKLLASKVMIYWCQQRFHAAVLAPLLCFDRSHLLLFSFVPLEPWDLYLCYITS